MDLNKKLEMANANLRKATEDLNAANMKLKLAEDQLVVLKGSQNNLLGNQGVTVLSNLLTGQLTQGLGRLLFLSEVTFDVLPPNEYVVRLAKSLDDRDKFLVTFTQVVRTARYNQNEQQYGVEWRFQPNLLTRISLDNFGQARFWFQGLLRF